MISRDIRTRIYENWRRLWHASKSVRTLTAGSGLGQGIVLLVSPIATRLYSPQDFATLAIFVALLSILTVPATLRYELAIPLPSTRLQAVEVAACAAISAVFFVGVVTGILALSGPPIMEALGLEILAPHLWLVPLTTLVVAAYNIGMSWAIRQGDYSRIAGTRVRQGLLNSGTQLSAGWAGFAPVGLLLGYLFERGGGALRLLGGAALSNRGVLSQLHIAAVIETAKRYKRFPYISSLSGVVNAAGVSIVPILLVALYGPTAGGLYALAQRVMGGPVALLGEAVRVVYLGKAAGVVRGTPGSLEHMVRAAAVRLALIAVPVFGMIAVGGPPVFAHVFGGEWADAGTFVRLLVPMYLAQLVVVPLSQTLTVLERQGLQLLWDFFRLFLCALAFYTPWAMGYPVEMAILAYSVSSLISYAVLYWISLHTAKSD